MSKDPNDQHNPDNSPNTTTPAGDKKATNPISPSSKKPVVNKGKQQDVHDIPLHGGVAPQPLTPPREFPFIDPDEQESHEIIGDDDDFEDDSSTLRLAQCDADSGPEEMEEEEDLGYKSPHVHRIIDMDW